MLNNTSFARLRTVPNRAGSVWVGLEHHGLFYSHNGAEHFEPVPDVNVCRLFAFGKGRGQEACLYVYGVVCGQEGIFRSEDFGLSWARIDTPENGLAMNRMIWPQTVNALAVFISAQMATGFTTVSQSGE